jgi:hypothetical protein
VVDTGGLFRDVTAKFWNDIKTTKLHGGILFDGDEICLIQQNSTLVEWNYPLTIGKLLFWTWIQMGSWPKWLDPLHIQYAIDGKESILCTSALYDHIPFLYYLANDIKENLKERREEDLKSWIFQNDISVSK